MTETPAPFTWIDRVPLAYFDERLQQTVQGYRLRVTWTATGSVLTIYLPATSYTPDQVNAAILAAGAKEDAMASLGAAPPA